MRFLTIALALVAVPLYAWVLSSIWGWYMVDHFNLPPLPMKQSLGVILFITLLTYKGSGLDQYITQREMREVDPETYDTAELAKTFVEAIVLPVAIWVLAYVVWRWI